MAQVPTMQSFFSYLITDLTLVDDKLHVLYKLHKVEGVGSSLFWSNKS